MNWPMKFLTAATLGLAFLGSYAIVSTILDRDPPIKFEGGRALTLNVPQGGELNVQYSVVRHRSCTAVASRYITDSTGTVYVPSSYTVGRRVLLDGTSLAGRETYTRSVIVPEAAAVGPALYDVRFVYVCNIWHRLVMPIKVVAPTVKFNIIAAPDPLLKTPTELRLPRDDDPSLPE